MFTATLYNSTGFNSVNIPDSEATLNASAASTKNVPAMDILQLYNNLTITIRAFEEDVMCADYLKLTKAAEGTTPQKSAFYAINGYNMTSGDTIDLSVTMCGILTAGGVAFLKQNAAFIDGMISRHHLTLSTDLAHMINEMPFEEDPLFAPSYPTKLELDDELFLAADTTLPYRAPSIAIFASSSVELDVANSIVNEQTGTQDPTTGTVDLMTRNVVTTTGVTGKSIKYDMPGTYDEWIYTTEPLGYVISPTEAIGGYPGILTCMYDQGDLIDFRTKLVKLVANNMQNIIEDVWVMPRTWVTANASDNAITGKYRKAHIKFFDYNENEEHVIDGSDEIGTRMGKFNQVVLVATGSGNIKELSPEDTLMMSFDGGSGTSKFVGTIVTGICDPRPEGGVSFAVGKRGSTYVNQTGQIDRNNLKNPKETTHLLLDKSDLIEGGKWYHMPMNVIGQPGYNANKSLFDAQQQSKDLALDIQVQSGTRQALGGNPLGALADVGTAYSDSMAAGNGFFSSVGTAWNALWGQGYTSQYGSDGTGDVGRGVLAGNERAIATANRMAEKSAELAQFKASNVPQPVVVSKATGGLDLHGNALMVFKRSLDNRDIDKYNCLLHRFGYKHSTPFDVRYLNNRQRYNYIECSGVSVKIPGFSKNVCSIVADELCNGVRIWHEKPFVITTFSPNPNAS